MPLRRRAVASVCLIAALLAALLATSLASRAHAAPEVYTLSVWLKWTNTGDDGMIGRASRYDLRYSARPISGTDTLSWWNTATMIDMSGRVPGLPGTQDSVRIDGLVIGSTYYALMRIGDEVPNWSRFSNLATLTVVTAIEGDQVAPHPVHPHASPNPFGSSTVLTFSLRQSQEAKVAAFDARGRLVRRLHQGSLSKGEHRIEWDGRDDEGRAVGSGVYFLHVRTGSFHESVKVFHLR